MLLSSGGHRCCSPVLPQVVKMAAGAGGQGISRTDPSGVLGRDPGGRRKAPERGTAIFVPAS